MRRPFDRVAASASERIINWIAKRVDPAHKQWVEAMHAELYAIEGGWRKLTWVLGGVRLAWSLGRKRGGVHGQVRLPAVGSVCVSGAILGVGFWFMFTRGFWPTPRTLAAFEGALALYLFATGFLAGPVTKGFVAGGLIGVTSGVLGVFSGFVMDSPIVWINPLFYVFAGVTGAVCGGLGAVARAHIQRARQHDIV
jgi:hypothetical protein